MGARKERQRGKKKIMIKYKKQKCNYKIENQMNDRIRRTVINERQTKIYT